MTDEHEPAALRTDAQLLLAHWREADDMPAAARARVLRRLARPTPVATPEPRGNPWTWVLAVAAALALVWWASVQRGREAEASRHGPGSQAAAIEGGATELERAGSRSPQPPTIAELPPAELPTVAPPAPPSPAPTTPSVTPPRHRDAAPPIDADPPESTLEAERVLIAEAWQRLAAKDPAGALALVDDHARRFAEGILAPERRAVAIVARCIRGDGDAQTRAATWIAADPRSPLVARVRAACDLRGP